MSDYELTGSANAIGFNETNTVGAFVCEGFTTNQTRTGLFTPEGLLEWAQAVNDAYGDNPAVEIVFTPNKPLVAKKRDTDKDVNIGIGLAPRLKPDDYEELKSDNDE